MATPGGKKPNKQQINDAGNEIGLDLANAIGKAISRALTSYDFSPLGKSITKNIGKIDVAGLLKTDDAKIKQLAANAKTTLESSIGLLKIGTEIDNDKLSAVQKALQQLSNIDVKAAIGSIDTSLVDTEFGKLKIADLQALVTEVDTSLISEEVNKLNPLALQAKLTDLDSSIIDSMPQVGIKGNLEVDPANIQSQLDKTPSAELKATVGEVQQPREDLFSEVEINPKIGKLDFDADRLIDVVQKSFMRLNTTLSLIGATLRKEISSSPFDQMADGVEEVSTKSKKASSGFQVIVDKLENIADVITKAFKGDAIKGQNAEIKGLTDQVSKLTGTMNRAFDAGRVKEMGIGVGGFRRHVMEVSGDYQNLVANAEDFSSTIKRGNKEMLLSSYMGRDKAKVYASLKDTSDEELQTLAETLGIQNAQKMTVIDLKKAITEGYVQSERVKALNEEVLRSYEDEEVAIGDIVRTTYQLAKAQRDSIALSHRLTTQTGLHRDVTAETVQLSADLAKASKEELVIAAQKLGIVGAESKSVEELASSIASSTVNLAEQNKIVDDTVSSYGDMDKVMKQVIADNKLKTVMVKTGLTGEYAETARLLELQKEQGLLSKEDYATALERVKAEHHLYEERAKQLELTESLATWQLGLKEELEEYEKGWEKFKSKLKAIVTDKEVLKSFLAVKGLESLQDGVKELTEEFGELRKEGLTVSQATHEMGIALGATFSLSGMSLKENAEIMAGMREQMGSMHHVTSDTVAEVGKMAKTFGISAAEAGKLQGQFQNMPGATAESATNTLEFAGNLAKAAGVAPGDVMKDIAGNSESVAAYTKDGGKNIATAAVAAKKLGVEFGTLTKMSEGLLDFESSINKQMEASLLLGRSINLDKARQAALNGDIVGATQEMLANVGGEAEFNKMNVLQRKALADAMGVSVGELSKMVKHQDELKNLTEEQQMALATGEVTMDEILANTGGVASRLKEGALSAVGLFAGISQVKKGLQDSMSTLKDFGAGFKAIREDGGGIFKGLIGGAKEVLGLGGKMKEMIPGADTLTEKATDTVKEKATDLVQDKATGLVEDKAGDLADKAADKGMEKVTGVAEDKAGDLAEKAAEGTDKVGEAGEKVGKPGMMQGFKDNMKSLADGFKEMGTGKVIAGIFNTMIAGPALVVALPAIPFLLFMGKVALNQLATNFTNLASGLTAMASTFAGSAALGVFAIASIPSIAAIPFLLFMGLTPLAQLATNFTNLAAGLTAMSGTFAGSAALAVFGLAAVPSVLSIPFLLFMGLTPLAQLATNFTNLGAGLTAMSGTFAGSAALLLFAIAGAAAVATLPFLIGISLVGKAAEMGLKALGQGLAAFGNPSAALFVLIGIGLLAALGVAMIPFAAALAIATPAIEAFGNIIIGIFQQIPPIIAAVAAGFTTVFGVLADNWQILIPAGIGLQFLGAGLFVLGAAALVATPGIIAFGLAMAIAGPAITQLAIVIGDVLIKAMEKLPAIIDAVSAGFVTIFSTLAQNWQILIPVGVGLAAVAVGLGALGGAALLAFPGLLLASIGLSMVQAPLAIINAVAQTDAIPKLAQSFMMLAALGPGLLVFSISLGALGAAGMLAFPGLVLAGAGLLAMAPGLLMLNTVAQTGVISTLAQSITELGSAGGGLAAVGLSLLGVAGGLAAVAGASIISIPAIGMLAGAFALATLPMLAFGAAAAVAGAGIVAAAYGLSQLSVSLPTIVSAGPGLLAVGIGLGVLGTTAALAFPGLLLAGAGLMAMVPGLFLVNQVAQADALTALSQTLTALSAASGGLASVSASLFGIAGGLAAITLAGISAMPIIGALVGLAAVAPALASIGSLVGGGGGEAVEVEAKAGGESNKDDSMKILIEEIRGLRAEIAKGGTINMDGRKVGEVVRLAMNTSGVR